jgi:hypothetical protein
MPESISQLLTDLTGQEPTFPQNIDGHVAALLKGTGIGYSQLNELLLLLGYDRLTHRFFQYLLNGKTEYEFGGAFKSFDELRGGIDRFRTVALLGFGNIKFAFKYLSAPTTNLNEELARTGPTDTSSFESRHDPLMPIEQIPGDKTYYLGYIIKRQLDEQIQRNPDDKEAKQQLEEREEIVRKGLKNHAAYLASDHLDVYVATSMRERHEYQIVHQVVQEIFGSKNLQRMKIRWFDPTQAYCEDRIDKGLVEGLMLKRAACTVYLAQESDTLGKDSELASTLAQGKPVIAFIPEILKEKQAQFVENLLVMVKNGMPTASEQDIVLNQFRLFSPDLAWKDSDIQSWLLKKESMNLTDARQKLGEIISAHYDRRADILKRSHPLGIQINLEAGVANGVLVARTTTQCAELIERILTNNLEFSIEISERRAILLKEKTTQSVFRVQTGDLYLSNTFWNFYTAK